MLLPRTATRWRSDISPPPTTKDCGGRPISGVGDIGKMNEATGGKELQDAFQTVCAAFFPGWDRAGRWRIVLVRDLSGATGRCDV
jgi:hypothetical protein